MFIQYGTTDAIWSENGSENNGKKQSIKKKKCQTNQNITIQSRTEWKNRKIMAKSGKNDNYKFH